MKNNVMAEIRKKIASFMKVNQNKKSKVEYPDTYFLTSTDIPALKLKETYKSYLEYLNYSVSDFNKGIALLKIYKEINTKENREKFSDFNIADVVNEHENLLPEEIDGFENIFHPNIIATGAGSVCKITPVRKRKNNKIEKKITLDLQSIAFFSKVINPNLNIEDIKPIDVKNDKYFNLTLISVFDHEMAHYGQEQLVELMDEVDRLHFVQSKTIHLVEALDLIANVIKLESDAWDRAIAMRYHLNSTTEYTEKLKLMLLASEVKDFIHSLMIDKEITLFDNYTFKVIFDQDKVDKIKPQKHLVSKYEEILEKRDSVDDKGYSNKNELNLEKHEKSGNEKTTRKNGKNKNKDTNKNGNSNK